ncbi:aldolase [Acidothermaceae bacterium B102]|nr:aldolase [Acidothermaceae bacterium B102]
MSTSQSTAIRTLADIAGSDGIFSIIAMDQRNTLKRMFTAVGIDATDEQLRLSKTDVARALTPLASGILFDPTFGVPAITGNDALAKTCGLLVASEPAERGKFGVEPITHRDPQLDSQWVLDQGGDANKYFAQLRVDRPAPKAGEPDLATLCLDAVREVVADCAAVGIPSVIENLVYPLEGEDFTGKRREDAIIEAARALNEIDCDLLKLEYPGSPEGCRRLAEILDRPWAVLSAGVPFDEFTQVLEVAFDEGGASGFIAGRSVWRESLALEGDERQSFLTEVARPRLERLINVATGRARPWTEFG